MKNKKQSILIATGLGLIATIAVAVYSTNNNSLLNSLAGGIVHTSDKGRTLTLDSTTPLEIDGTTGSLIVDNIGIYANMCQSHDNGVVTMTGGGLYLYCATAGLNGTHLYGFNNSTIASLSIVINSHGQAGNLTAAWVNLNEDLTKDGSVSSSTQYTLTATNENQTLDYSGSCTFISGQGSGRPCINIFYSKSIIDIVSLTVEYTCK